MSAFTSASTDSYRSSKAVQTSPMVPGRWAYEERYESSEALVEALKAGVTSEIYHRDGAGHRLRCLAEVGHLLSENTWGKLDRLFLSGTEPTHPGHVAYDGAFADVSVY